jgi:hypothetical protein
MFLRAFSLVRESGLLPPACFSLGGAILTTLWEPVGITTLSWDVLHLQHCEVTATLPGTSRCCVVSALRRWAQPGRVDCHCHITRAILTP